MINPIFCGTLQENNFEKKPAHSVLRFVQKSFTKSQGSNNSSKTKKKKSLKSITNKQNKPVVSSQFKRQAKQLNKHCKQQDFTKIQKNKFAITFEEEKGKNKLKPCFSFKQNRRKNQPIQYLPSLNLQNKINSQSQNKQFLLQVPQKNTGYFQQPQIIKKNERSLQIKKSKNQQVQKNMKYKQSFINSRQKSKSTRISFLSKPTFGYDLNDKYSLKPHFSVINLKSPSLQQKTKNKTQVFYSIQTQRQRSMQKNIEQQKMNFKIQEQKNVVKNFTNQTILQDLEEEEKNQNKQQVKDHNNFPLSRFFSLKSSRFFIPNSSNQPSIKQKTEQKSFYFHNKTKESKNLSLQIINGIENLKISKNMKQKNSRIQNDKKQTEQQIKQNLTESTKVSSFFDRKNEQKKYGQNMLDSQNDQLKQSRFANINKSHQNDIKKPNLVDSKVKSWLSKRNFFFHLRNYNENLSQQEKDIKNSTILKRNTISHQTSIQNFTLRNNISVKNSFINKTICNQTNKLAKQVHKQNNSKNKSERNQKPRPSFFADLQKRKEQQKIFRKQIQKIILQKDEQQSLQSEQANLMSTLEVKDAESFIDSEFNNSQKDSELQFVLHSTDKIQLKSFAFLNTFQSDKQNFSKYK